MVPKGKALFGKKNGNTPASAKRKASENGAEDVPEKKIKKEEPEEEDDNGDEDEMIPDVFLGDKILILDGVNDRERLERYVMAYGADLLQSHQAESATHVVYPKIKKDLNKEQKAIHKKAATASHVTFEWLIDSIQNKKAQDTKKYKIGS